MRVEAFLNQSFGEMVESVPIAVLKEAITFRAKPAEPGYTSVAGVKGNLRSLPKLLYMSQGIELLKKVKENFLSIENQTRVFGM